MGAWKVFIFASIIAGLFAAEDPISKAAATSPKAGITPPKNGTAVPRIATPSGNSSSPKPGVKNSTAKGSYYGHDEYDEHDDRREHRIFRGYDVPLVDDYICDLDATILVVTNSDTTHTYENHHEIEREIRYEGRVKRDAYPPAYPQNEYGRDREYERPGEHYGGHEHSGREGYDREHDYDREHHGYGRDDHLHEFFEHRGVHANADRLRCSHIAANSEHSCLTCCRLSARRDRSISKHKIVGFLVENTQLNYDSHGNAHLEGGYDHYNRKKRDNDDFFRHEESSRFDAIRPIGDHRCVCCAPKRYRPFVFDRYNHHPRHHGGHGPY